MKSSDWNERFIPKVVGSKQQNGLDAASPSRFGAHLIEFRGNRKCMASAQGSDFFLRIPVASATSSLAVDFRERMDLLYELDVSQFTSEWCASVPIFDNKFHRALSYSGSFLIFPFRIKFIKIKYSRNGSQD